MNFSTQVMFRVFVQVRLGSTRLPGKALKKFSTGKSVLDYVIGNVLRSSAVEKENVIILTSSSSMDDPIQAYCKDNNLNFFRGSEEDVLGRFCNALTQYPGDYVLRVCADNPFLQKKYIDGLIDEAVKYPGYDYYSYVDKHQKPTILTHFGFFSELVSGHALLKAEKELANGHAFREHVTPYIYKNPNLFSCKWLPIPDYLDKFPIRLTLDTLQDFTTIDTLTKLVDSNYPDDLELLKIIENNPELKKTMLNELKKNEKE